MKPNVQIATDFFQAQNEHNLDQALALLSPDIRFEMTGLWVKQGPEEIKGILEWNTIFNTQYRIEDLKEKQGMVTCTAKEKSDWYDTVGIGIVVYESYRFGIENGLIKQIKTKIDPVSERNIDRGVNLVMKWAMKKYSHDLIKLIPRGIFLYSREGALQWKDVLEEWKNLPKEEE